jgi:alpha-glucosidase
MYKHALRVRKELGLGHGSFDWVPEFTNETTLGYRNGNVLVIHNFANTPIEIPDGEVIVSSKNGVSVSVEPDQTVWLKTK